MEGNLRNVTMFQDRKTYRVRIYIGGALRLVGITKILEDAARFADMATLFFWPYRIRRGHPPGQSCMNFTVEQAQHDLDTNDDARQILEYILDHLIAFGHLPDPVKANEERIKARQERDRRRTVKGELLQCTAEIQAEIISAAAVSKAAMEAQAKQLVEAFNAQFNELQKQVILLQSQVRQLRESPTPFQVPQVFPSVPVPQDPNWPAPIINNGHGSHCACPTCVPPTMC